MDLCFDSLEFHRFSRQQSLKRPILLEIVFSFDPGGKKDELPHNSWRKSQRPLFLPSHIISRANRRSSHRGNST